MATAAPVPTGRIMLRGVRLSFAQGLFAASVIPGADATAKPKYNCGILIPPDHPQVAEHAPQQGGGGQRDLAQLVVPQAFVAFPEIWHQSEQIARHAFLGIGLHGRQGSAGVGDAGVGGWAWGGMWVAHRGTAKGSDVVRVGSEHIGRDGNGCGFVPSVASFRALKES